VATTSPPSYCGPTCWWRSPNCNCRTGGEFRTSINYAGIRKRSEKRDKVHKVKHRASKEQSHGKGKT
jgi:hypothetical protein